MLDFRGGFMMRKGRAPTRGRGHAKGKERGDQRLRFRQSPDSITFACSGSRFMM